MGTCFRCVRAAARSNYDRLRVEGCPFDAGKASALFPIQDESRDDAHSLGW